jgi:hypothetical protein
MKKIMYVILIGIIFSCSTTKKASAPLLEDEFLVTRKYIGNFIDCYHTGPDIIGGTDLIWIKTTIYSNYGKISVFGKSCDFSAGDKIYLRPISSLPESNGKWVYQIENDFSLIYRVSEYRFENNVFTRGLAL